MQTNYEVTARTSQILMHGQREKTDGRTEGHVHKH